jgi:DNA-binding PadR family transcriptional regulator
MEPIDFLPLQEPTFYILLSLASGTRHGYAILKDVEELSGRKVNLSTGTLYGALNRLLDQGMIERLDDEEPAEAMRSGTAKPLYPGKPRKAYRLTTFGRSVLAAETERMQALVRRAQMKLRESDA